MSKARFNSNRASFFKKSDALVDMVQGHMAQDIEVAIKTSAGTPVKTGDMKAETRHFRSPKGGFRVESGKAYSAYQEAGARADGSHRVQNYSTAGTSAGWFKRAIDGVVRNKETYLTEARKALNL